MGLTGVRPEPGLPLYSLTAIGVLPGAEGFAEANGLFVVRPSEIPEPGTLGLFGAALLVMGALRKRYVRIG
jgi:PEP-CTERM motif